MPKKALITGITGQDGAYLAKLLLGEGYEVWGAVRRASSINTWRLTDMGIDRAVRYVHLDLVEFSNILETIKKIRPDEVYNLAAQSFVKTSFEQPIYTADVDALGVARLLEALRMEAPEARFYQSSTSEMFGKVVETPQKESTPFYPRSPYGVAKLYGHWITVNYRESYAMHASSGILFNHESPLRGTEFVTRKVTLGLARIMNGEDEVLELGNLDAKRDWGFAGDYVEGMWLMLQADQAGDYVLASGETHSVRDFVSLAAEAAGMPLAWEGEGEGETGRCARSGKLRVRVNPEFYRPAEVDLLLGDPSRAEAELGWQRRVGFAELVKRMVAADMDRLASGSLRY